MLDYEYFQSYTCCIRKCDYTADIMHRTLKNIVKHPNKNKQLQAQFECNYITNLWNIVMNSYKTLDLLTAKLYILDLTKQNVTPITDHVTQLSIDKETRTEKVSFASVVFQLLRSEEYSCICCTINTCCCPFKPLDEGGWSSNYLKNYRRLNMDNSTVTVYWDEHN